MVSRVCLYASMETLVEGMHVYIKHVQWYLASDGDFNTHNPVITRVCHFLYCVVQTLSP